MRYNYDKIPLEMRQEKRWVLWILKDLNGKKTKLPINAYTGYNAKSNDSNTWSDFMTALLNCDKYGAVGLGFMLGGGWFGVDIDHSLNNKKLIDDFVYTLQSYCEVSQSGEGIHIICKGSLPKGARRKGNIEMYDNARFFALTGNIIEEYPLFDKSEEIKVLYNKYLGSINENKNYRNVISGIEQSCRSILTDAEVLSKAENSSNGWLFRKLYEGKWEDMYKSQSEADITLASMLAFWCGKDLAQMDRLFRASMLYREKWDSLRGEQTYGQITLDTACKNCRDVYNPHKEKMFYIKDNGSNPIINSNPIIKKRYDLTDTGNAERFIDSYGDDLKYNFDNKCWLVYDGKTWKKDATQYVKLKVDRMLVDLKQEIAHEEDNERAKSLMKNYMRLSSNNGKDAMLKEAMHLKDTPVVNNDFDKQKELLNCLNGVVNLKSGELIKHDRSLMLSKNTNIEVDLNNKPTRWIKFLNEVFNNDQELIDYIQLSVGYSLTGETKEQCFYQCYGEGANGKSVFLDVIYNMLGDYALNAQVDSILSKGGNSNSANTEIARMCGARFVRTNEPNEGSRFNEGLIKQLVSGDVTTARFLYGNEFEFKPCFKLWIATNYKIKVRGTDYGIWRRQRLVPFEQKFEGKKADKKLSEILNKEISQILGWAVKGAVKYYQSSNIILPKKIEVAVESYKDEMDIVAQFIKSNIRVKKDAREKASEVYKEYSKWAREGNEYCMTQSKFGIEMGKRFEKKNVSGYIYYEGFVLKSHDIGITYIKGEE